MTESTPPTPPQRPVVPGAAQPPSAPAAQPQVVYCQAPPRRRSFFRKMIVTLFGLVVLLSIIMNVYLMAILASQFRGPLSHATLEKGDKDQIVAVYGISGVLDGSAVASFELFYEEVVRDPKVKAVVLRVNSPGGGVTASDQIHEMVQRLKTEGGKKVVVSMGTVAASGGYYVSAPADEIFAEPTTVTGSIGVMMGWFVLEGTLEKIGIEPVLLKSTSARGWKDEASLLSLPDERQRQHLQEVLDKLQARFETVVRAGRKGKLQEKETSYTLTVGKGDKARPIKHTETEPLNGKIYLADEAKELGLIDEIGYLDKAIDRAAKLAGVGNPTVIRYAPRKGFLEQVLSAKAGGGLSVDASLLDHLQTPRLMMMWKVD